MEVIQIWRLGRKAMAHSVQMTKENRSLWCEWVAVMRKGRGVRYSLAIRWSWILSAVMLQQYHLSSNQLYHCPTTSLPISRTFDVFLLRLRQLFGCLRSYLLGFVISMSRYRSQTAFLINWTFWNPSWYSPFLMWVQNQLITGLFY